MKKFLATLLTLTMLGSVSVPALAAEQPADTSGSANTTYPADEANTPYDQGYDDGYKLGYEKGEALCKQDIANGTVTYAPDYNYSETSDTYEDGLTDGTIDGMDDGYTTITWTTGPPWSCWTRAAPSARSTCWSIKPA